MSIKRLLFNKLNALNLGVLVLIALLAQINGGAGMNPDVNVFVPAVDGNSFNMPTQILVGLSVLVAFNILCMLVLVVLASPTKYNLFYVRYTCVLFCASAVLCILALVCPTIPGAELRITLFSSIGTILFLFGLVDMLFTTSLN